MTYIYLLEFKDNTFYIGKTINIKRRLNEHRKTFEIDFDYIILDEIENNSWKFWERYWVSQFHTWGFKLKNKNNGGGGPTSWNEEQKRKLSMTFSNRKITWIDKMSQGRKGKKYNIIKTKPKYIINNLPEKEIIKEYTTNNKSAEYISSLYNVSVGTILNILKQNNVKATKNKVNDDIKKIIIEEYIQHYNINNIVDKTGLSRITIKNHLQEWGIFKDQRKRK